MIKVFGAGRGAKKPAADSANDDAANKKQPGELRMEKELEEMDVPTQVKLSFPDKDKVMEFNIDVSPEEGYWKGATYRFVFTIPHLYPHEAPKVKCETRIYHPNIDLQGNVCLNILREEWKPVLSISAVVYGIMHLFSEPNPNDPLNKDAAKLLRESPHEFDRCVQRTLRGCSMSNTSFPRLI